MSIPKTPLEARPSENMKVLVTSQHRGVGAGDTGTSENSNCPEISVQNETTLKCAFDKGLKSLPHLLVCVYAFLKCTMYIYMSGQCLVNALPTSGQGLVNLVNF